jgi:tetratricopeptide (TPR) repeat protein
MLLRALLVLLAASGAFSVWAQAPEPDDDDAAPPSLAAAAPPESGLPAEELTESTLYELLLGEIAAQRGDTELAARTYLQAAKRTRDPRVVRRAVEIANFARLPEIALEAARLWYEISPQSAQALRVLIATLVRTHRVEEAEPYILKLLAADANTAASGLFQLGRLLAQNPDKAANLGVVQRIAERYAELPEAHFAVAQAAAAARDEDLALAELRRALELRPDWEQAVTFEAELLRRKSPQQADALLSAYLERHPDSRDVRMTYARLLIGENRYADARAQFEAILAAHRDDTDAIYAVGLLAMQAKDYAIAESNLKRLLELGYRDPDAVRFTLGQLAEEQKDWPRALEWYRSIREGERAFAARLRAAGVLAKEGKLDEGRALLHETPADDKETKVRLVIAEAQLLREANRYRDAFELLQGALAKDPDQPDLLYDTALAAEKLDRTDILEANLRKLIKEQPDHAHAYNALGYSLADRNERLPEAKQLIERALEISPDDYYIVDSMGWVLYRMGDLKGALAYLRRAWEGRRDAEIGAHFGEVLWKSGEHAEAQRVWAQARDANPDNETLQKTIERLTQ